MSIFQKIIDKEIPAKIVYEDKDTLAFLDLAQNTKGHTLVIPKIATRNVLSADDDTIAKVNLVAAKLAKHIVKTFDAKGANILTNAEEIAGQTVFHYHVHIIPRYSEDELIFKTQETNFDLDKIHLALIKQ